MDHYAVYLLPYVLECKTRFFP